MSELNELSCLICGGEMFGLHGKVVCQNCGYREDYRDLFPMHVPRPTEQAAHRIDFRIEMPARNNRADR